jgi:hypothetical protein
LKRDILMPYNDEFTPDVSKNRFIFFQKKDSSKLEKCFVYKKTEKKVDIENL